MVLLEKRRTDMCLKFAQKAAADERFQAWFPKRHNTTHCTRNPEIYHIDKHRTERMRRNPVTYMKYALNNVSQ